MTYFVPQTVTDWKQVGYTGLRIMHCPRCRVSTWASWGQLEAVEDEDVISVAKRLRCEGCGEAPTGLAVVASMSPQLH